MNKCIVLDGVTQEFLSRLRELRQSLGLTQNEAASALGIHKDLLRLYEYGRKIPYLERLIMLADFYCYDISGSINYKFYHGEIKLWNIKAQLKIYGLRSCELSEHTRYSTGRINQVIRSKKLSSILCLASILEVINHERESWNFRKKLLGRSR